MKSILLITFVAASVLTSSCNTFIGMGRDMRITVEGMEKSATKIQIHGKNNPNNADTSGAPVY
jgi:predicted small secreted protein